MLVLPTKEWSTVGPDHPALARRVISSGSRASCEVLTASGRIEILSLAAGLRVRTFSWVGRIQIDDLTIVIEPKIQEAPFAALLRYAYGLRDLVLGDPTVHAAAPHGIRDLLVRQLVAEATELLSRGLHRDYERKAEGLALPRGRLDFAALAGAAGRPGATLPCIHYPRTRANVVNVALLGALKLAGRATDDPVLRHGAGRLSQLLALDVPSKPLTVTSLDDAEAAMDRRHRAYEPVLAIARLLLEGAGIAPEHGSPTIRLPGFLFDMNRFFQALLTRFLRDHLKGHDVEDERPLKGLYAWDAARNPLDKDAPSPRPDLLVKVRRQVVAVLDAKYRDLWNRELPASMLYQLTLYAIAHPGTRHEAVIVYPTVGMAAREQAVALIDPRSGRATATVVLRPLDLVRLAACLAPDLGVAEAARLRNALAYELAFGAAERLVPSRRYG